MTRGVRNAHQRGLQVSGRSLASTVTPDYVVECWERDNPLDAYQGATGSYSHSTASPIEGEASLAADGDTGDIIASDSLEFLPTRGDVLEGAGICMSSSDLVYFGIFDSNSLPTFEGYIFSAYDNDIKIIRVDNGEIGPDLAHSSVSLTEGKIYYHSVDFGNPTITYTLSDLDLSGIWPSPEPNGELATVSVDDDTHDSGAYGFRIGDNDTTADPSYDAFFLAE